MFHSLDLLQLFDSCHLHSAKHVVAEVSDKITIRHMYERQMSIDKRLVQIKLVRINLDFIDCLKVSNGAKIRNRYNQVPHLTQDTNGKVTNSQKTPQTRAKRSALSQQVTTKHI